MADFTPAPWPAYIRDYFTENAAIAEVPEFLHIPIRDNTEYISDFYPEFRYKDILIEHDGSVQVHFVDEEEHVGLFMETVIDCMSDELTNIYRQHARV